MAFRDPADPLIFFLGYCVQGFISPLNAKQFTPRSGAASVSEMRFFCPLVSPNLLLRSQNPALVRRTHQMWNLKNAQKSVCLQLDGKLLRALIHSGRSHWELRVWLTCGKSPWMFKKKNLHSVSRYFVFFSVLYLQLDATVKCSTCRGLTSLR